MSRPPEARKAESEWTTRDSLRQDPVAFAKLLDSMNTLAAPQLTFVESIKVRSTKTEFRWWR